MIQPYQLVLLLSLVITKFRRPASPPHFLTFLVSFVTLEAAGKVVKEILKVQNVWLLNVSALGSVAYYLFVFLNASRPNWIRPVLLAYGVAILISLISQGPRVMMSAAYIPGMLMTMAAIWYYLYHLVIKQNYTPLARIPQFWLAVGIMLFFSSAFPMLVFGNALSAVDRPLASRLWPLVSYGNLFLALGFLAVSLCQLNTRTSSSPSP